MTADDRRRWMLVLVASVSLCVVASGCSKDDEGPVSNPSEQGQGGSSGSHANAGSRAESGQGGGGSASTAGSGKAGSGGSGNPGGSGAAGTGATGGSGEAGTSEAGDGGTDAGADASIPSIDACEMNSDCGFGEIDHEILSKSDCECLFGCAYLPLNQATLMRRRMQYEKLCDPGTDGQGDPCPIDDCIPMPNAVCKDQVCGAQDGPPES